MMRAVVIKTVGDRDIGEAIASGLTVHMPRRITPGEKSAAARKRERQQQKLAQFRAAAMATPKWYEVPLGIFFLALDGVKAGMSAMAMAAIRLPGRTGRFFKRVYRLGLKDSHMPFAGLVGTALAWGLSGALICKLVIGVKYFWR